MKLHKEKQCILIICLSFLFVFVSQVGAQDLEEIKNRMLNRKSTVTAMKNKGVIGEGNDGYLHVRTADGKAQQIVAAENNDRRMVNAVIAKREGTTVDNVSRKLSVKMKEVPAPGHWLQKGDGTWYRK